MYDPSNQRQGTLDPRGVAGGDAEAAAEARRLAALPLYRATREAQQAPLHQLARVMRHLDRQAYRDLERRLPEERRRALRHLLALPPGSVGASQRDDYVPVNDAVPATAAARVLEGRGHTIAYLVRGDGRYLGVARREALAQAGDVPVRRLLETRAALEELDDHPRALRAMRRAGTQELPVTDRSGCLTGVVRRADLEPPEGGLSSLLDSRRLGGVLAAGRRARRYDA